MYVEQHSRWLSWRNGELVVWKVLFGYQQGRRETWRMTHYAITCEETGEDKEVTHEVFQQRITNKQLIPIGDHTKEEWIEKSRT